MKSTSESCIVLGSNEQQKVDDDTQPIFVVKQLSFFSLGVLLIFTVIFSWVISNHARETMIKQGEEYSYLLATNLNQQVFRMFVVPTAIRYGKIRLVDQEQFERIDKVVKDVIQDVEVESVNIYDSKTNIISYSTIPHLVGKKDAGKMEYNKSLQGINNSKLITKGSLLDWILSTAPLSCTLKTYTPFKQIDTDGIANSTIMGVFEIETDLSKHYNAIIRLQAYFVLGSCLLAIILSLVLRNTGTKSNRKIPDDDK